MELQKSGVISTGSSLFQRMTRVLVESAALYSLNHLLYIILYEVQSQVEITTGYLVSLRERSIDVFRIHNLNMRTGSEHSDHHLQLNNYPV